VSENTFLERQQHFTIVVDSVLDDERLTKFGKLVYLYLCRYANKERTCFPSIRTLAQKCDLAPNSVQKGLQELADCGYLQKEKRKFKETQANTSNFYTLTEVYHHVTQGVSPRDTGCVTTRYGSIKNKNKKEDARGVQLDAPKASAAPKADSLGKIPEPKLRDPQLELPDERDPEVGEKIADMLRVFQRHDAEGIKHLVAKSKAANRKIASVA